MELITVNKASLLSKIKTNREAHRQLFLDAQEVYRERMIAELDSMLKDARDGKQIRRAVSMPEPQDHTEDYDRVIEMLEMSVNDEVELDETDFARYVRDQWEWQRFMDATIAYASSNVRRTRN